MFSISSKKQNFHRDKKNLPKSIHNILSMVIIIYTRPKKKRRILNIHFIRGDFLQSLANDLSQFER